MDCGQLPPGFQVHGGLPRLVPLVPLAVQNEKKSSELAANSKEMTE